MTSKNNKKDYKKINMNQMMKPSEVNINKIEYSDIKPMGNSGGRQIYINYDGNLGMNIITPKMRLPFGISKFEGDTSVKYSIDMSFDNMEENEKNKEFYDLIQSVDEKIIADAQKKTNCLAWLRKKTVSEDVVKTLYTPSIKRSKDKETGEFNDKFPPTFKAKVPFYNDSFQLEAYNYDKTKIENNFAEMVNKGQYVSALIKPRQLWFSGGKFGLSWSVVQIKLYKPRNLIGYAFRDSDSEEE